MDGVAWRVPVTVGSVATVVAVLRKAASVEAVNAAFARAAKASRWKGVLAVSEEPIVSSDVIGSYPSAIVDAPLTRVVGKRLVHVAAWYDNEWAYANRLVELARALA
jgi:glyceraldehyde 3-phosphate dehydrogenase